MSIQVHIETVPARKLAAVRRRIPVGQIASTWRPALDKVWHFLGQNPGLRTDGHNIFLYHHPDQPQSPMNIDFGVEVTRAFSPSGEVALVETPAGRVATAVHIGPYDQLGTAHDAIHSWAARNRMSFAGKSWEIYGDPSDDIMKLETRVDYLLS
jgi:effector-binding domain-containing protein